MNQENKLPTAETILKQEFYGDEWEELMSNLNSDITPSVVSAMEEHTRLHIADYKRRTEERMIELETELEKLRAWKESAMKTLGVVDLQECGKLLNIGLGQSIADKIVPGIKELRAENEKLKKGSGLSWAQAFIDQEKKYENATFIAAKELVELEEQNQNLRDTLGQVNAVIANEDYYMDWNKTTNEIENIVLGALKGLGQ